MKRENEYLIEGTVEQSEDRFQIGYLTRLGQFLLAFFLVSVSASVGFSLFFSISKMNGYSMMPTIKNNDLVLVSKTKDIRHFDLVYIKRPGTRGETSIRRVIGVPGDSIRYEEDMLYVNEVGKSENYLNGQKRKLKIGFLMVNFQLRDVTPVTKVPKGSYFLLGDNRQASADSRHYGFVNEDDIIGVVDLTNSPRTKVGIHD